jgi:hypothetical protein
MRRQRITLEVSIELDPVPLPNPRRPGFGHSPESMRGVVERALEEALGHYHPRVKVAPNEAERVTATRELSARIAEEAFR